MEASDKIEAVVIAEGSLEVTTSTLEVTKTVEVTASSDGSLEVMTAQQLVLTSDETDQGVATMPGEVEASRGTNNKLTFGKKSPGPRVVFDRTELRERLTPTQYQVTQEHQTERQYTNEYYKHNEPGIYRCVVCDVPHFSSTTKYDSGSGWPSFWDVVDKENIRTRADASAVGGNLLRIVADPSLIRTEVSCGECGSHLGHVFQDGPKPTGLRYCVNSASLKFVSAPTDSTDGSAADGGKTELISHPATLGGCGGVNGACTRRSKLKSPSPRPAVTTSTNQQQSVS